VDELCQKLLVSCDKLISEKQTGSAPGRVEPVCFSRASPDDIRRYSIIPFPKQPGKIGNALGLTFAARVFTTPSTPPEPIIESGNKQTLRLFSFATIGISSFFARDQS